MSNVFIDPVLITTPDEDAVQEVIETYLSNLHLWLREALTSPHTWYHFVLASSLLEGCERFPTFRLLQQWQRKYRLNINIQQLMRDVNKFFRSIEYDLEENFTKLGYLIEPQTGSILIKPPEFSLRWLEIIREETRLLLATTCACKQAKQTLACELSIATLVLAGDTTEIEVAAILMYALPDIFLDSENKISQSFPLIFTPDDLLPLPDIILLWSKGENAIKYAIDQQFRTDWQSLGITPFEYRIKATFLNSVKEHGLDTNESLLNRIIKTASDIIADKAKDISGYELHPFREEETADSPQLSRPGDNAKAWRLMLTKHGAGWRLHYWKTSDLQQGNIIEFSNIEKEQGPRKIYY